MPDYIVTPAIIPTITKSLDVIPNQVTNDIANTTGLAFGIGMMFLVGLIMILCVLTFVLWIWSIIHIAKNENFTDENQKIIWLLIVVLVGPLASLVYYFAKPSPRK